VQLVGAEPYTCSLPCSQQLASSPYPEPYLSSPNPSTIFFKIHSNITQPPRPPAPQYTTTPASVLITQKKQCYFLHGNALHVAFSCQLDTGYTVCPTRYRTRHFFNNSNTNEDIATKFEQEFVHCVRNE